MNRDLAKLRAAGYTLPYSAWAVGTQIDDATARIACASGLPMADVRAALVRGANRHVTSVQPLRAWVNAGIDRLTQLAMSGQLTADRLAEFPRSSD